MIQITDSFFEDISSFKEIIKEAKIPMTKPEADANWQGERSIELGDGFQDIKDFIIKNIEENFNIKKEDYKNIEVGLHYRKDFKVNIHSDPSSHNCLIYLDGEYNIFNGTGFYTQKENEQVLDLSVGFKENRAIFFNPKILHASLTGLNLNQSSPRWTINTFLYEE